MIDLNLPKDLREVRGALKGVAETIFRPVSRKYDEHEHEYPVELDLFEGNAGTGGRSTAKEGDGEKKKKKGPVAFGANMTTVVAMEQMSWGDAAFPLTLPGAGLGNAAIDAVATDEQWEKYGKKWTAMAITEASAGSDSGSIQTTAVLDGDEYVLNGEKIFVTNADRCDQVVVWATVDPEAGKAGVKSFIVEKGTPGFKLEKLEHKMGIRASDTGTFVLKDCRIPKENLLGNPEVIKKSSKGFKGVMKTFDNTRPYIASMSCGVTGAALDFLKDKLSESGTKIDYEKNVNNVSSTEKEYLMMEANLEAMRLLTWRAAWMADNRIPNSLEASMAKAKAGKMGTYITQKVCDLIGPIGFTTDELPEKWMRDSKILDIFEGTGQIQHLIISRNILKLSSKELK